jgi:hypothetical protein
MDREEVAAVRYRGDGGARNSGALWLLVLVGWWVLGVGYAEGIVRARGVG